MTQANIQHLNDPIRIRRLLRWQSYTHTGGWYVQSIDLSTGRLREFGQFKPDKPIQFQDGKSQKYLSFPKKAKSEVIYLAITHKIWQRVSERYGVPITDADIDSQRLDLGFWSWVKAHPEIPIVLTEGLKKAGALLTLGYIGVSLTGVWNGQVERKKLNSTLEPLAVIGRPFILAFDADLLVKQPVRDALIDLGRLLRNEKASVHIALWKLEQGKGIDDLLVNQGENAVEAALAESSEYSRWLKE